ncbi:MAG: alpha-ketoacid dehydrogenase subunit beta [Sphaerochaetaceae bacterium]|jgi:pyruvate/2-oxoglutarate/acetoin dehydrogenase E1 component
MREITFKEAINEAIREEMRRDDSVIFLGEDIGIYGGGFGVPLGLIEEFGPSRIIETPISELTFTGAAVGSAMTGLRPIVEVMFSDFITLAMDPLVNQAAKNRYQFGGQTSVPMVFRGASGSGTGAAAQHSQSLEAWVAHVPGLKVVIPSTPYDAKGLMKTAIRDNNPVIFYEQKLLYATKGEVPPLDEEYTIPFGQADIKKGGEDVTLITYGRMVQRSLDVAYSLKQEKNIDVEVIDIRTLVPLDVTTILQSATKTGRVIVVHEAVKTGGFGAEIVSTIVESDAFFTLKGPILRVAGLDVPIPFNKTLESLVVPTPEKIREAIIQVAAY